MTTTEETPAGTPSPSFEESLRRLEKVVKEMESGELPLDEMMKRFEEGRALVAACNTALAAIRQRVEETLRKPE